MEQGIERLVQQVDALIAQLDHTNQRFEEAVNHQQETVSRLHRRNRMLVALIAVVVVGLIGIGGAVNIALDASDDAKEAGLEAQRLVEELEAERQANSISACRLRNNANLVYREATAVDIEETAQLLADVDIDPDIIERYVEARESGIPDPAETDRDCDGSGDLDENDYPS